LASAGGGAGQVGAAGYPAITPSAARSSAANSIGSGAAASQASAASVARSPSVASPAANEHDVPSPLLGTFYRSPKPGAPPFVEVGSPVEADTVIAIIEVMKLMNTVRAGVRGTVTDIFSADGSLVEFEQPLIRVSKAG
jgi:acetyl-CoA carboxylase biotin carboxyl carrier protein